VHDIPCIDAWHREVPEELELGHAKVGVSLVRRIWGSVVSRVRDERHGGCILVVPRGTKLADLPVRVAYPSDSTRLPEVIRARMSVEPQLSRHVFGQGDIELAK